MQWSYRFVSGFLFLASVIGMAFALYLEHGPKGLNPCPLCVFQRVGLIGLGIISLIAFLHNPVSNGFKRFYALLGTLLDLMVGRCGSTSCVVTKLTA